MVPSGAMPCRIEGALGHAEACPGESCPFWEAGRATRHGRCAFAKVDLESDHDVAVLLVQVRRMLESARAR